MSNEADVSNGNHSSKYEVEPCRTLTLDLPPSCISFVPLHTDYFIVGTYFLEEDQSRSVDNTQTRSGSLLLFRLFSKYPRREAIQKVVVPYAVLDLRFSPHNRDIFAVAGSTGSINVFSFNSDPESPIAFSNCIEICAPDVLVLSLAWSIRTFGSLLIAASLSNGNIEIFDAQDPSAKSTSAQAHSLEAWVVAWSLNSEEVVLYSGGDDSALCRHRVGKDLGPENLLDMDRGIEIVSYDTKTHEAGVTAILPLCTNQTSREEILVTGSYDEFMRVLILAPRSRRATLLAEKQLGGGVWQIKQLGDLLIPSIKNAKESRFHFLVSCMHVGCRLVEICRSSESCWRIEILAKFEEHESMNYASDVQPSPNHGDLRDIVFVSTSFYDKKLCVWSLRDP